MPNLAKPRKNNKLERRQKGIQKARKVLRVWRESWSHAEPGIYDDGGWQEQRNRKTRKRCSCYMCANRRELEGKTRQEHLADLELIDQIEESPS